MLLLPSFIYYYFLLLLLLFCYSLGALDVHNQKTRISLCVFSSFMLSPSLTPSVLLCFSIIQVMLLLYFFCFRRIAYWLLHSCRRRCCPIVRIMMIIISIGGGDGGGGSSIGAALLPDCQNETNAILLWWLLCVHYVCIRICCCRCRVAFFAFLILFLRLSLFFSFGYWIHYSCGVMNSIRYSNLSRTHICVCVLWFFFVRSFFSVLFVAIIAALWVFR